MKNNFILAVMLGLIGIALMIFGIVTLTNTFSQKEVEEDVSTQIEIYEDESNQVSCYILKGESISCLPNSVLKNQ